MRNIGFQVKNSDSSSIYVYKNEDIKSTFEIKILSIEQKIDTKKYIILLLYRKMFGTLRVFVIVSLQK
jgi:hypothetical protein